MYEIGMHVLYKCKRSRKAKKQQNLKSTVCVCVCERAHTHFCVRARWGEKVESRRSVT